MALRSEKIRIEVFGPAGKPVSTAASDRQINDVVLRLARLIGRQMAREQFQAAHAVVPAAKRPKAR